MSQYEDELNELVGQLNRQANVRTGARSTVEPGRVEQSQLAAALSQAIRSNASDILLVPGTALAQRINGKVRLTAGPALSESDVRSMVLPLLSPLEHESLQKEKSVDLAFQSSS